LSFRQAPSPQEEPYRYRSDPLSVTLIIETPPAVTKSQQRHYKSPKIAPPSSSLLTTYGAATAKSIPRHQRRCRRRLTPLLPLPCLSLPQLTYVATAPLMHPKP